MNSEGKEIPNLGFLPSLRKSKQFYRLLLYAWSEIEFNIDQAFAAQFNLSYLNKKAAFLLANLPFAKKLEFLKAMKVIGTKEYSKVKAFQKTRNDIVHRDGMEILHTMTDTEKDEMMDRAVEVAEICLHVAFRNTFFNRNIGFMHKEPA